MDFPAIPVVGAIQRVYALSIFYAALILRLMWLPLGLLVVWTAGFDLLSLAIFAAGQEGESSDLLVLLWSFLGEVLAEFLILNFLALRVFKLLLLEHSDERSVFDSGAFRLLPTYSKFYAVVLALSALPVLFGVFVIQIWGEYLGIWLSWLVLVPFALAGLGVYCWLSFVLPAIAIPVPYQFKESHLATRGTIPRIAIVTLASVVPWFLLSFVFAAVTGAQLGPTNWVYWLALPVIAGLHCLRTIFFVLANAVCFEERTGWHPGAEKVEV